MARVFAASGYVQVVQVGCAQVPLRPLSASGMRWWAAHMTGVSATWTGPGGVAARATGLFVVVDVAHFSRALTSGDGQDPVAP